jgi:type II secretory pathway pseudopilin PulG
MQLQPFLFPKKNSSEQGLTLIECLMGILILTSILVGIAPPLGIVVATRVQNRRAEQAQQLAQAEIDRVRILVEQRAYTAEDLPGVGTGAPTVIRSKLRSPASCGNEDNQNVNANELVQVDVNGNCEADFLVQSIRNDDGPRVSSTRPPGRFTMTVRVYTASARSNITSLQTQQASLKLAGGEGSQRTNPLAVVTTEIFSLDRNDAGCILNPTLCFD